MFFALEAPMDIEKNPTKLLLTTIQAAEILSLKPRTMESWRFCGRGPRFIAISTRAVRYRLSDITEWIDAHARISTSDTGNEVVSDE